MKNLSLKKKVIIFITAAVFSISLVSTLLFTSAHLKSIEREVIARGIALSESLARSVDEGLAYENLNLIKNVSDIVHTDDVMLTQVYSIVWLGIAAVPADQHNQPPHPAALEHFASHKKDNLRQPFFLNEGLYIDIYTPVMFDPHDARLPNIHIGYVRLKISTANARIAIAEAVTTNIAVAALLTIFSILVLSAATGRYILRPLLKLHQSIALHKQGKLPAIVPVDASDEIGEVTEEFNHMSRALMEREARLAEEKERLSVTLRSIGDAVIVTDIHGAITLINKAAENYTGWAAGDAVGKPLAEVFPIINERTRESCEHPVDRVLKTGTVCALANHTSLIRKDGTEISIEDSAAPIRDKYSVIIGVVLVFRDVTEKNRMEQELLKVEKLESVGVLAGGLAHDFNNLLTALLGNISIAKMYVDHRSKAYQHLIEAETASRRATDLTHQLLTFSKGGAPIRRTQSIADVVREAAGFALSGTTVAHDFEMAGDLWNVNIDAGQISQVFHNLILNAVQAMPQGGTITFSASNVVLDENRVPSLREGAYVKVSVRDTGAGIPEDQLPRIFDPYYTTKKAGSGLGLASVYSVIKRHDGHILVESKPDLGTTFHIYLPASRAERTEKTPEESPISGGHGVVLVMDDEEVIRRLACEMLHVIGYEAVEAEDGKEALEKYQLALAAGKPFQTVIMDLTIPGGMGGQEAISKLLAMDPNARVIVSSGYSNDPIMANFAQYGFKGVVTKPYSIESFSKALEDARAR